MLDVSMKNIAFSYIPDKLILGNIEMDVEAGDFVCLLGQSGCGKSTVLRLLAGLETADKGEIFVGNKPIGGPSLERGVVFQDYGLFPWMTAGENIMIGLQQRFPNMNKIERKELALQWMSKVNMDESLFDKLPGELSGGQKQRCAIARVFALDPPILLMDEPFGSLDAVTKAMLQDLVMDLWQQEGETRKTIFFVTHDVDEALFLSTHIAVLSQSPSQIIYNHSFKGRTQPTRQNMHINPEIIELRNRLIRMIYKDAESRIERENIIYEAV